MYLKLAGCFCIIFSMTGIGYSKGREYQQQLEDTGYLRDVIFQIGQEIDYTHAPFAEICQSVSKRVRKPYKEWLENMAKELENGNRKQFYLIWEQVCQNDLGQIRIGKEERQFLHDLGGQMGGMDQRLQEQIFLRYAQFLEERRVNLRKTVEEKKRLCHLLGITAGIFTAILIS